MESSNPTPPWEGKPRRKRRLRAFRPQVKQLWAGEASGPERSVAKWLLVFVLFVTVALSPVAVIWLGSKGGAEAAQKNSEANAESSSSSSEVYYPTDTGPAQYVMENVVPLALDEDYISRKEISTGRFLRDFERNLERLDGIDTTRWRVVRRGRTWVEIEGPWVADGVSEPKTAVIRFVLADNKPWRLENIRILPKPWEDD